MPIYISEDSSEQISLDQRILAHLIGEYYRAHRDIFSQNSLHILEDAIKLNPRVVWFYYLWIVHSFAFPSNSKNEISDEMYDKIVKFYKYSTKGSKIFATACYLYAGSYFWYNSQKSNGSTWSVDWNLVKTLFDQGIHWEKVSQEKYNWPPNSISPRALLFKRHVQKFLEEKDSVPCPQFLPPVVPETDLQGVNLTPLKKGCEVCFEARAALKVCSMCKKVKYCSVDHQRIDWPNHKRFCEKKQQ